MKRKANFFQENIVNFFKSDGFVFPDKNKTFTFIFWDFFSIPTHTHPCFRLEILTIYDYWQTTASADKVL